MSSNISKSEADFRASLRILSKAVNDYIGGFEDAYRTVAVQLRLLLCDRNPLLPRVRPDLQLHKLKWTEILEGMPSLAEGLAIMMPGQLTFSGGGLSYFELLFAKSGLLPVNRWIEQPFFSPHVTVVEIIKSVADKEGAHSDPSFNDTLLEAKVVKYVDVESHIPGIIAIGQYLVRRIADAGRPLA